MGHDHQLRRLGRLVGLFLDDGGDAHLVVTKSAGDAGEDAGPVGYLQPDVVAGHQLGKGPDGEIGRIAPGEGPRPLDEGPGGVQDIGHDGRGGRKRASAGPLEEDPAAEVTLDLYGVEGAVHLGQQLLLGHQGRMHAHLHRGVLASGHGQELDGVAQLTGVAEIARRQPAYALPRNVFGPDAGVEGQAGQDGQLVGGIVPVDVVGGVRLGVAKVLGLGQTSIEIQAISTHASEDVVSGAVDDGADAGYLVGGEIALKGRDDGDGGAHAGLIEDVHAVLGGQGQQLRAVLGHDLLVGGHHIAAMGERVCDELVSGVLAAQQLDDDVHVAGKGLLGIGCHEGRVHPGRLRLVQVALEDAAQEQGGADALRVGLSPLEESAADPTADHAQPQQDDIHAGRHGTATASSGKRVREPTRPCPHRSCRVCPCC